jgi:hypothetical protein
VSYVPTTKKAALITLHASYTETVEGGSGDAKDNAVDSLVEDKRWFIAVAKRPTPLGRIW